MFNVLFTSSLCSPGGRLGWLYLTIFFLFFPLWTWCMLTTSAWWACQQTLGLLWSCQCQNISYCPVHGQIRCEAENMDPCFLSFGEVDHAVYMLSPAQYCICLEAFLIRNKRLRKWFIIKIMSLWSQVTQMQRVVFRFCFLKEENGVMF